jgi:pyruvate carboxylase
VFSKILVANRGEIAVRAFRAAYELGARTVAVFPYEDRNAVHRIKADEAYLIGERGHAVHAYLDIDEIIRVARESGADAVYPGYGFLSENPDLAQACADAGIAFIGPPASVLTMAGNKVRAVAAARAAGVPVLRSSAPSADVDELVAAAEQIGFPVFAKAVAGGGGRGMRRVDEPGQLADALATAMREAQGAFGDATMFLEQAVLRPRHLEVQVTGTPSTSSSGTAPCSAGTRRWWRSRRRPTWTRRSGRPCAGTPWRSPVRSGTSTPAPWSSCWTPSARAPGGTCSSR